MKKSLKFKIKRFFSDLWFKYVKKPYLDYLTKKEKRDFDKNVIKSFHKQFGVHPSVIKEAIIANEKIFWGKKPNVKYTYNEHKMFLREELKKSAILTQKIGKSPLFYDPEISDIHNESIIDKKGATLKELITEEIKNTEQDLKKQQNYYEYLKIRNKLMTEASKKA
jgi:hypothetical protein